MQAKLLRAVETREFRPVGAAEDVRSDFRLIAAANEDIWKLEQAGRFRSDLAHRFSSFVIRVPPLREHSGDVPALVIAFMREACGEDNLSFGKEVLRMLTGYDWPGNVRELRHVVRSAIALGGRPDLRPEDVREALSWRVTTATSKPIVPLADRRLLEVLEECSWNTEEAARQLSVHRTTIYRRIKRVGLDRRPQGSILRAHGDQEANASGGEPQSA